MKNLKVVYWIFTIIFSGIFLVSGTMYMAHAPVVLKKVIALGLPVYIIRIIGTAKILGALALVIPKIPARLKEWAYAGFTINLIGAFWSHLVVEGFTSFLVVIPFFMTLLTISYVSWRKSNPGNDFTTTV